MTKSESVAKLAEALSKAQSKIKGAVKDSENPFFKSHYADLASVLEACREQLAENGLSVAQGSDFAFSESGNLVVYLETILMHTSGEWISFRAPMKPAKDDPQGWGSVTTYYRRYGLSAMAGVAQVDDDGNEASGKPKAESETRKHPVSDAPSAPPDGPFISIPQSKRLYAIAKSNNWNDDDLHAALVDGWGIRSTKDVPRSKYEEVCNFFSAPPADLQTEAPFEPSDNDVPF